MTDALVLGTVPGELTVNVTLGDAWEQPLVLKEGGVPVAWPAAPVLEFATSTPLNVTAVLGPDAATSTANAQATWSMTELQVATLKTAVKVRLAVSGETYWRGRVICLS